MQSHIHILNELCVLLDVFEAEFGFFAHEAFDQVAGFSGFVFLNGDADELAGFGVHGGFFEVFGVHLAQAFKALDVDFAFPAQSFRQHQLFLDIVWNIDSVGPLRKPVQRGAGEVEVACVDEWAHLNEEEGHQQGCDVSAIDVRVGHDDDFVISEVFEVKFGAHADAQGFAQV